MAKAFDLVHKVADSSESNEESKIPFEDESKGDKDPSPKKRIKVEIVFFYLLLFAIFFVMGAMFLSPGIFSGNKTATSQTPAASPGNTPDPGFAIEKEGENKEVPTTSSPAPAASPVATEATASPAQAAPKTGTKIQILNGTTVEGKAASFRTKLANKGIVVASIGNYFKRTVKRTTIYYTADYKAAAQEIQSILGGILVQTTSATTGNNDVLVIVGKSS